MKGLFKAKIYHKRFHPKVNEFTYGGFFIRFQLDKMNSMSSRFFSINRFNLFSFYEKDHGERDGSSLYTWAQKMLAAAGLNHFKGDLVLQTFPRVLGYVFNPVSFWYCYSENELLAVICEVNNTFGESHNYVLKKYPGSQVNTLEKQFHVSPFYPVSGKYEFNFKDQNFIHINYFDQGRLQLATSVQGTEIEWSDKNLLKLFIQYPFYTFFVVVLIHFQAAKLFFKKINFYTKPQKLNKELTYEHIK